MFAPLASRATICGEEVWEGITAGKISQKCGDGNSNPRPAIAIFNRANRNATIAKTISYDNDAATGAIRYIAMTQMTTGLSTAIGAIGDVANCDKTTSAIAHEGEYAPAN